MNNTFYSKKKIKKLSGFFPQEKLSFEDRLKAIIKREYSKLELYQKLCLRYTSDAAKAAVKKCVENDWLSESRYIEMLHRHIISQCYGPLRFVMEAKKKGINSSLYDEFLRDTDWNSVAVAFLSKKIPQKANLSFEDKQKYLAALARRGFSNSLCYGRVSWLFF